MRKILELRIEEILKVLSDGTRRKILTMLSKEPLNPAELADNLNISRPAVEKHLKLLQSNYICERTVEPFPTPHFVYHLTIPGLEMMDAIDIAMITFFQSMDGIMTAKLDELERGFVLGRIKPAEYQAKKKEFLKAKEELDGLDLTRIWIEEAKKVIDEHQSAKK
ncbi:MAG: ArsR/SmtB family transcription factor [Candidatus Heimdallarchaeota archaeon]